MHRLRTCRDGARHLHLFATGKIINEWQCSACHNSWHTFVYPESNTDAPVSRSGRFRVNAGNYLMLVNTAPNDAARHRFARMSDAWFALADTQDWLDGVTSPALLPQPPCV